MDQDDDGLDLEEEYRLKTSDILVDSDFDTLPDSWEVKNERNPAAADYQLVSSTDYGKISSPTIFPLRLAILKQLALQRARSEG